MPDKLIIYTDGGCQHNPGPAAIGVVIQDEAGKTLETISRHIGQGTNNQAEYRALIAGLERALELQARAVEVRSDSQLMVEQMSGRYKVKDAALKPLFQKAQDLRWRFGGFSIGYIPRHKNHQADRLAGLALKGAEAGKPKLGFTIRKATSKDIEGMDLIWGEVEEQHARALPQIFRRVTRPARERKYVNTILSDNNMTILIAEYEGRIIGLIQVMIQEAADLPYMMPRRFAKISDLVVAQEFHHHGTGLALMDEAEKWALERRAGSMELNVYEFNQDAQAFYKKQGYVTASRTMWKEL